MRPVNEKYTDNTFCIFKDFEAEWACFCPPKPCIPLLTDAKVSDFEMEGL